MHGIYLVQLVAFSFLDKQLYWNNSHLIFFFFFLLLLLSVMVTLPLVRVSIAPVPSPACHLIIRQPFCNACKRVNDSHCCAPITVTVKCCFCQIDDAIIFPYSVFTCFIPDTTKLKLMNKYCDKLNCSHFTHSSLIFTSIYHK